MNENNNGRGLFYGVIGVATLIVAIIGATFAYFSVNANIANNSDISGNTVNVSDTTITGTLTRKTPSTVSMVPLKTADLQKGIAGEGGQQCIDANGAKVCDIYTLTINNTSNAPVSLAGNLTITATDMADLRWSLLESTDSAAGATAKEVSDTVIVANELLAAKTGTKTYYFVIWFNETDADQNAQAGKSYTGTVTFTAANGGKITAQFSSGS